METNLKRLHRDTIIIGAGQAGLSAGYHLKKAGQDFIIIDADEKIGDSWRKRWDSLKLFTPPKFNALPGWPQPFEKGRTTKDTMADYLQEYARKFELPVLAGVQVNHLTKRGAVFILTTSAGIFTCNQVIVATGSYQAPRVPAFAKDLNPHIHQIHSSQYRNAVEFPAGNVLVAGSATSGIEIAMDVALTRDAMIAGKPSFIIPTTFFIFGRKFYWWFATNILTIKTPIGRKVRKKVLSGGGVLPQQLAALEASKVERVARITGVRNGYPLLEDGNIMPVSTIIWCTGYQPDFSWMDIPVIGNEGWPLTDRGVTSIEGLYFMGMLFQYRFTSALVGGVGKDAAYIAKCICKRSALQKRDHFVRRFFSAFATASD